MGVGGVDTLRTPLGKEGSYLGCKNQGTGDGKPFLSQGASRNRRLVFLSTATDRLSLMGTWSHGDPAFSARAVLLLSAGLPSLLILCACSPSGSFCF